MLGKGAKSNASWPCHEALGPQRLNIQLRMCLTLARPRVPAGRKDTPVPLFRTHAARESLKGGITCSCACHGMGSQASPLQRHGMLSGRHLGSHLICGARGIKGMCQGIRDGEPLTDRCLQDGCMDTLRELDGLKCGDTGARATQQHEQQPER